MDDFFWVWKCYKNKYHWASWKNLNFIYDEWGVGMRISKIFVLLSNISNGGSLGLNRHFGVNFLNKSVVKDPIHYVRNGTMGS